MQTCGEERGSRKAPERRDEEAEAEAEMEEAMAMEEEEEEEEDGSMERFADARNREDAEKHSIVKCLQRKEGRRRR